MSEWIKLKDNLPPRGQKVLWFQPCPDRFLKRSMFIEEFEGETGTCTHWMPLPPDPK